MSSWSPSLLLCLTLLLQLIFLSSVFDVYFSSPVLRVDESHRCRSRPPPARRLVIFVADGLRAHSFFEITDNKFLDDQGSFLRAKMAEGVYGVSHTRLPTESRPGHVAIMAGMYEDPSAITRGWKTNPVSFDTIFNASRQSFAWGSPDILPMFGEAVAHMHTDSYDAAMENFAAEANITSLDTWVFDRVVDMFHRAELDQELREQLRQDEMILFLHLLGCDTTGHAHKPHSSRLEHNVRVVDAGIRQVVETMEDYYRYDGRTSYIFTADHGMTDWGSHGAASDHETMTPLVLWGAGIKSATKNSFRRLTNDTLSATRSVSPSSWAIDDNLRIDVAQADLAPLMASLLGIGVPKNSVGKLPIECLDLHPEHLVEAHLSVSKQILEQYYTLERKFELLWPSILFHQPFESGEESFEMKLGKIERLLSRNFYKDALELSQELHTAGLKGLNYYLHYYRHQLYFVITCSYALFIFILLVELAALHHVLVASQSLLKSQSTQQRMRVHQGFALISLLVTILTWLQDVPNHYLVYHLCPICLLWLLSLRLSNLQLNLNFHFDPKSLAMKLFIVFFILETMIMAFFDRRCLILALFIIAIYKRDLATFITNLLLSLFPLLPTIGNSDNTLLVLAATILTFFSHLSKTKVLGSCRKDDPILLILLLTNLVCGICVVVSNWPFLLTFWSRPLMHFVSWSCLLISLPLSLCVQNEDDDDCDQLRRRVALALLSMHALLSVSYENLFLLVLNQSLLQWMKKTRVESNVFMTTSRVEEDAIDALLLLFYSVFSFFGTGNLASLNSFDPSSLRPLVATFNPFLMGFLLLLKVLIPFQLVALYAARHLEGSFHTLVLLLFSQLMSLHFFFLVTDRGSWLDIGTSLSHFIIAQATTFFLNIFLWIWAKVLKQSSKGAKRL